MEAILWKYSEHTQTGRGYSVYRVTEAILERHYVNPVALVWVFCKSSGRSYSGKYSVMEANIILGRHLIYSVSLVAAMAVLFSPSVIRMIRAIMSYLYARMNRRFVIVQKLFQHARQY